MKVKFITLLFLLLSTRVFASQFPEETFIPVANSGFGCYVQDDSNKQIMVADSYHLRFNHKVFVPVSHALFDGKKVTRYRTKNKQEELIFRVNKWQSGEEGLSLAKGNFEYRKQNKRIYRGKFFVECGV